MRFIKPLCLLIFLLAAAIVRAQELSPINGISDRPVYCGCSDTLNNTYLVTSNNDTIIIKRYDVNTKKWSNYFKMSNSTISYVRKATCQFLFGDLYLTGVDNKLNSNQVYLQRITPNLTVSNIGVITFSPSLNFYGEIHTFKIRTKMYYYGNMSNFLSVNSPNLVEYNLSGTSNIVTPNYSAQTKFANKMDTLIMAEGNGLFRYNGSVWTNFFKTYNNNTINDLEVDGANILLTDGNNLIRRIQPAGKSDSLVHNLSRPILYNASGNIYVSPKSKTYANQALYSINSSFKLEFNFRSYAEDTTELFLINNDSDLFIYTPQTINFNGSYLGYIVRANQQSFKPIIRDTVDIIPFHDKNRNGKMDFGENVVASEFWDDGQGLVYNNSNNQPYRLNPYDNENLIIRGDKVTGFQNCYGQSFSGGQSSRCYLNPRSHDTIYIPFSDSSIYKNSIAVHAHATPQARLASNHDINIKINSRDCDIGTKTFQLKVTLQTSTVLISTEPAYTSKVGNVLTFNLTDNPSEDIKVRIRVNYPVGVFYVSQRVKHHVKLIYAGDKDSSDNTDSVVQRIVYSYDPNLKTSFPEGDITSNLKQIRYFIQFQNEGTDDAWRVRVVDTLNLKMPVWQFKLVGASHDYKLTHVDNIITWTFDNIHLKPKSVSEELSKGYICLDAYVKGDLRIGDSIINNASIYFDYNEPIHTNDCVVRRIDLDNDIDEKIHLDGLKCLPNPFGNTFNIINLRNESQTITVCDINGRIIHEINIDAGAEYTINTEDWETGIYIIQTEEGVFKKIIKL
ncbi:MAG TPA: T9SS type A sorting domain-containing protein [Bacteroidia bacterium]